jgi:predicted acyltransferase
MKSSKMNTNNRLLALDVFRGMTIFFMIIVNTPGSWTYVYAPLRHAPWDGCTPTDLVFPFFLFIVGVAMSYSFRKYTVDKRSQWIAKVLKRTLIIFLIGLALNWFPFYNKSISDLRIFGVLQRIALGYGGAGLLIIFLKKKYLPYIFAAILISYYLILILFGGTYPLSLEHNLVRKIDLLLFGENHIYGGYGMPFDPEGLLSSLPSIGTALLGDFTGNILLSGKQLLDNIRRLVLLGIGCIVVSVIWHYAGFPINKPIWSSSYVLFAGGLAMTVLASLLWLIDVKEWKGWTSFFRVFGLNPLFSYILSGVFVKIFFLIKIGDKNLYAWLYDAVFRAIFGAYPGSFIFALSFCVFVWMFALILYKRNIVVKV